MNRGSLYMLTGLLVCLAAFSLYVTSQAARSPKNPRFVMSLLRDALAAQPHECVPLGWNPAVAGGSYYPSYSAEYREDGVWLHPYWLGLVYKVQLRDPNVRTTYDVMNALVRTGMLERTDMGDALMYRMTVAAEQYYYEDGGYGNNPDHLPYLCYSNVVPQRVVKIRITAGGAYDAGFEWRETSPAQWARDQFVRLHSVILAPRSTKVVARLSDRGGTWHVSALLSPSGMLPQTVDPAIWPKP